MSDFGGKLRLARERRGISLRQIAANTKISVAVLEALERNDISKLPGGIFSRAFVRSYAVAVGLDPDETVREFLDRFQAEPAPSSEVPASIPEEESSFESQQRMARVVFVLILVSVPLIGLVLYFTLRTPRPASHAAAPPPAAESIGAPSRPVTEPAAPPSAIPAPAPAAPINPPPVRNAPAAARGANPATNTAANAKTMRLELRPTGDCWIKLTVDGQPVIARLMHAGETEVHEVRDAAVIDVGNAGTFAYSIDGRPGKALGVEGQVRTARITRETLAQYIE
jgi:cytoskeleton protein RodZ